MLNEKGDIYAAACYAIGKTLYEAHSREIADSNRRLASVIEANVKREVNARDRVDISLEQYEKLKRDAINEKELRMHYETLFMRLGISRDIIELIDPDSFEFSDAEICGGPLDEPTRRCRIEFTVKKR